MPLAVMKTFSSDRDQIVLEKEKGGEKSMEDFKKRKLNS
jgi:hypothetical protein